MSRQTYQEPLNVVLENGEVVFTGPDGMTGAMSLDAARQTIARLKAAVAKIDDGEIYQQPLG